MRPLLLAVVLIISIQSAYAITGMASLEIYNPLEIKNVQIHQIGTNLECKYSASFKSNDIKEEFVWIKNEEEHAFTKTINITEGEYKCIVTLQYKDEIVTKTSKTYSTRIVNGQNSLVKGTGKQKESLKNDNNLITGNTILGSQPKKLNIEILIFGILFILITITVASIILLRKKH